MGTAVKTTTKDTPQNEETQPLESDEALEAPTDEDSAEMWGSIDDGLDNDGSSATEPEPEPEGESEPEEEAVQVKPASEPEEEAEPEPTAEKPTETAETQPATEPEARATEPEPEVDVDQLWQQREQALVEEHGLDQQTAEAIIDAPQEHLPRLFARVQARMERMVWENLNQVLPDHIRQVVQQDQTETERVDRFYETWPQIREYVQKNPDAEQTVQRMRDMFLQQPGVDKMTEEQIINQIGSAVTVAMGLPQQAPSGNGAAAQNTNPSPEKPKARQSASRHSTGGPAGGKKLGAFEELDAELDGSVEAGKGSTVF